MLVWFGCFHLICFIFFLGRNAVYQNSNTTRIKSTVQFLSQIKVGILRQFQCLSQATQKSPFQAFDCFALKDIYVYATLHIKMNWKVSGRPSQLAELSRSEFDPKLFSHRAYDKFFVTFATKLPYLTFCDKMRLLLI